MFRMGDRVSFDWNGYCEGVVVALNDDEDFTIIYSREINGWHLAQFKDKTSRAIELGLLTQEEAEGDWFWGLGAEDLTLIKRADSIEWIE